MHEELLQFKLQKVWTLVDLPNGKRAIDTKWVFRNKKDERGIVVRNKSRLVAQGYTLEEGIDYDEVFAPVARIEAIGLSFAYASFMGFIVFQMDVKSAFLYGTIEDEVYVCQPPGFEDPYFSNKVYKVEKALYGLHQAPRAWYETLSTYLLENRFRRGTIDKTLFIKKDKDDAQEIPNEFYEGADFLLRVAEPNKALIKDAEAEDIYVHLYISMIESLMYLTASGPDIMFAVCACARFQVTQKTSHLYAVKRIFRYLKCQPKWVLWYPRDSPFDLEAFSNSDYAGASLDRKSTTGEYVAAANFCEHVLWIQNQMLDYGFNLMNTKIYIDNEITICIVKNPVFHSKTKHIEIRHHFIRDSYEKKLIQVIKIHTDHNVADLLTKAFDAYTYYCQMKVNADTHKLTTAGDGYCCWVKTVNEDVQIRALVDGKKIIVTEASIRRDLQLQDVEGTAYLPNDTIFKELARMNAKTTAWNEFSSTMASAIICLATNQKFNFSNYILDNMVKNLEDGVKFFMFLRFVQVFLNHQLGDMSHHKKIFVTRSLTKKVFANMKRNKKGFSEIITPLFETIMVQAPEYMGEALEETKIKEETEVPYIELQTKESVPTPSNDPLPSGEDRMQLSELMELCTKLFDKVLSLEQIKTNQVAEIKKLKKRVKKLEGKKKMRTHGLKRMYKVGLSARIVSSDEEGLGDQEDASKQERITKIDVIVDVTAGENVEQDAIVTEKEVSTVDDEVVTIGEDVDVTTSVATLQISKDDKDQIALDEEVARKLDAQMKSEMEEEESIAREKNESNIVVIEEWDDVQATIDADKQLAEQIQAQEREQLSIEERSKLLANLIESRRKYFAAKRAEEIRNKPPTKAQQKKIDEERLKKTQAEVTEGIFKRAGDKIEQESAKRQKEDLEVLSSIVKERFKKKKPVDDMDNLLFQTLKTMFEHHAEDKIWRYQQGIVKVHNWKLFDSCGVYCVTTQNIVYYLLVEKMYPFTKGTFMVELTTMKFDVSKSMQQYFIDITNTAARLKTLGMHVDDSFLNIDELSSKLIQEEARLKKERVHSVKLVNQGVDKKLKPKANNFKKKQHGTTSKVVNGEKKEQQNNKCNFCKKEGHFQKDFPKRKA
uniref:Reverse transcriptase Ty1/copia-type domain-containing protein n=1 Tax=Tanacetum cinerariifolium TaxID=118510 RepID=A0A699HCU5_TANCI|nr:hypothetical protein [Tanacetum cinerariifolium]